MDVVLTKTVILQESEQKTVSKELQVQIEKINQQLEDYKVRSLTGCHIDFSLKSHSFLPAPTEKKKKILSFHEDKKRQTQQKMQASYR